MPLMVSFLIALALWAESPADRFRMNQVQVLGSHNSYKEAIDPSLWKLLRARDPEAYSNLEYAHVGLARQLASGLRKLEIDVVHDPKGGLCARPLGLKMVQDAGLPAGPPFGPGGVMKQPGFKVLHIPDIDFRTNAYTFRDALRQVREWSANNPGHLPVLIMMNAKDSGANMPGAVQPLKFDAAAFDAWDAEIREILPPDKLITPDDVRGEFPTLEAAARAHAWPRLAESRGRFLFVLDQTGEPMETYIQGHASLRGRVMFVNASEGRPEAAFRVVNDPVDSFHYIRKLVRDGYLVRTRADADTREARQGDYSRMYAAFDSGAHFVSTDYYYPDPKFGTGYQVRLPGGRPGRWNPLLAPPLKDLPPPE
jgi:hypothetical protein